MRVRPRETGQNLPVFLLHIIAAFIDELLEGHVARTILFRDRNQLPCVGVYAAVQRVEDDVKPADLGRPDCRLNDRNAGYFAGLLQIGVAVSADDQVHSAARVKLGRQLLVLLKSDMGEEDGQIDIRRPVGIGDLFHLLRRVMDIDQLSDQFLLFGGCQNIFRENADEKDPDPAGLQDVERPEDAGAVKLQVHIGVNDRESGAPLDKEKMRQTVVYLVIADRRDLGREKIHDLDRRDPFVLAVNDRSAEHIPRDHVENVLLIVSDLVNVTRQHGNAADHAGAGLRRQKITVEVVRMQDRQLSRPALFK